MSSIPSSSCRTAFAEEHLSGTLRKVEELRRLRKQTIILADSGLFNPSSMEKSVLAIDKQLVCALHRLDGFRMCSGGGGGGGPKH